MKIVLASTSAVKIESCKNAFPGIEIEAIKVASGINEQPMNEETLLGARNRLQAAKEALPGADYYVSIENGIFEEDGHYIDRAVISIMDRSGRVSTTYSDGVEFPKASVEETRKLGFDKYTVGKIMEKQGIVKQHDDPHLSLSGKSRVAYMNEAMLEAVRGLTQTAAQIFVRSTRPHNRA